MAAEETLSASANNKPDEEPLFDPSLKKKSKKKIIDFDLDVPLAATESNVVTEAQPEPINGSEDATGVDDMFDGLKKKKKKKAIPMDLDDTPSAAPREDPATSAATGVTESAVDGDLDFGEMKKKKKKGKKGGFDLEAFEKELGEGTDKAFEGPIDKEADDDADLGEDPFARGETANDEEAAGGNIEAWQGTDRDYSYQELLGRIFNTLRAQNPALSGDKKKYTIVPPAVARDGSKKTMFSNVLDICKRMRRQPDHVIQFMFTELGTVGSLDGNQRLIIKGRFQPVQIEKVLRKYIIEYVTCNTCRSPQTLLTKENRIYFMTCESCGSTRSVSAIKSGFQAQTGKRSKLRAQA